MYHIAQILYIHLPKDYQTATGILVKLANRLEHSEESMSFEYMFLPDYIEKNGLDQYEISIKAMEEITKFTSCEFAVRPFLLKYPDKMLSQLLQWSTHPHLMVRRLASEGTRPRLPWAMGVPYLKKDPSVLLPILENLKKDSSEIVRRSVANHVNDISKDHPNIAITLIKKWKGISKETDWLVRHASRTLLKEGNLEIMKLFGFGSIKAIKLSDFHIHTPKVKIGSSLDFSFRITNTSPKDIKIRLEYGIYFMKANKSLSRKVFKISEKVYNGNSTTEIRRKQSFKIITTRKLHTGRHQVSLIINGKELDKLDFELIP